MLLIILNALGCSHHKLYGDIKGEDISAPRWFNVSGRYQYFNPNAEVSGHPFFDHTPLTGEIDPTIKYIMLTPKKSNFRYDFDLVSGKSFKVQRYCEQDDVWGRFSGDLKLPNFSEGIVPRLLDQLGGPQQIVVFGGPEVFPDHQFNLSKAQKVRIVGGLIEQYCENYPCTKKESWESRLVLLGVDLNNPSFKEVKTIPQLKTLINWDYFWAFFQNRKGRNTHLLSKHTERGFAPAYRALGPMEAQKAKKAALKRGHYFKEKELRILKESCYGLYDYVWGSLNYIKLSGGALKSGEERKKAQRLKKRLVKWRQESRVSKGGYAYERFPDFVYHFIENLDQRFLTCSKYIRPANVNNNANKHWTFSFVQSFFKLKKLGYYFNCKTEGWLRLPRNQNLAKEINFLEEIKKCSPKALNEAFERSSNMMAALVTSANNSYRYLTYDFEVGGSHSKIYSWVPYSGKRVLCLDKDEEDRAKKRERPFPRDIKWTRF